MPLGNPDRPIILTSKSLTNPFFKSARARQAGELYLSLMATLILGIAVSVLNTRLLGPKAFGDFKFLQTIWTIGVLLVTFGLFTTGGNLLAKRQTVDAEKPLIASMLIIATVLSLVFMAMMLCVSFPLGYLYGHEIGARARLYGALLFVFPFQLYLQEALRGTNDIRGLALLNVLPQLAYLPCAVIVNRAYGFSLDKALLLYLVSIAATVLWLSIRSKPKFWEIKKGIREIFENNRAVGSHIYVATLVTTSTAYLGQFTLAYFFDTRLVGEFALALTITMPLAMIPNAVGTTFFKRFASLDRIPSKIITVSVILCITSLIGFLMLIKPIVLLLYTERFMQIVPLAYICAVGAVIHGMGDIYNRYLLANGKTSALRSNAIHLGLISVFGYFVLVDRFGVMGAAFTKLAVDVVYLGTMLLYYKNMRVERPTEGD
jgi:O-antigen/teichoic acid export membrane protein